MSPNEKYPVPNLCEGPPAPRLFGRPPVVWVHDLGHGPTPTPPFATADLWEMFLPKPPRDAA